jgi:spore coat protein H
MKLPRNRVCVVPPIRSPIGSDSAHQIQEARSTAGRAEPRGRSASAWAWLAVGLVLSLAAPPAPSAAEFRPAETLPGAELFNNGAARQIRIEMTPSAVESLRRDAREFVRATVKEEGMVYADVAIHLKGSVGSFREVDDKPDWTLDFNRFKARQKFHGLRRIHLNNSVEDPSYCNELLGSELFRAAGIPAPRVAHAVVTLNGRRLGLYVLKEGFTEDFLGCYFKQVGGNLYEPGEGHDVNQRLKRNSVVAPKQDRAALEALADAALEADAAKRWPRLEQALEVDPFVDFMAMEVMVGHRDGYCLARNNYRVYHDLDSDKMVFFPHGMDQLFGNPDAPWQPHMAGLVAKAVMETPEGKRRYRASFAVLLTNVFRVQMLQGRVDQVVAGLRPAMTEAEFAGVRDEAAHVKERIARRQMSLKRQLSEPERALLVFTNGIGHLGGWVKVDESGSGQMEQGQAPDHIPALHIVARSESGASWRTQPLLSRGRYRFEGQVKVAGVKPLPYGKYEGAGLRVAGKVRESGNVVGDSDWRALSAEFEVTEETQEVELVCELRASAGEVWFGVESLRLVQAP